MAYKFQLGAAQLSGSLVQEGAIAVHNESGAEVANLSQAGILSGSGAVKGASLSVDNNLINSDGAGNLAANSFGDGTATLQSGALTNATTVSGSGAFSAASLSIESGTAAISSGGTATVTDIVIGSGDSVITSGKAIRDVTTISGSGAISAPNLTLGGGTWTEAGVLSPDGAISAGGSVTAVGSFIIGSADMNEADLEKLDGITNGTAAASKAVVLDASKNIGTIGQLTASILSGTTVNVPYSGLEINGVAVSSTAAELNILDGVTATAAELNYNDIAALGTGVVSKALVFDASGQFDGVTNGLILSASVFSGSGAGLTNIDVTNLDAAGSNTQIQFNDNGEFAGSDMFVLATGSTGTEPKLLISGSYDGSQASSIFFGLKNVGEFSIGVDDGTVGIQSPHYGIDISGSEADGILLSGGGNKGVLVDSALGIRGLNAAGDGVNWSLLRTGVISGSGALQGASLSVDNNVINSDGAGNLAANSFGDGAATLQGGNLTGAGNVSGSGEIGGATAKFGGLNFEGSHVLTSNTGVILFGATADQELRAGVISGSGAINGPNLVLGGGTWTEAGVLSPDGAISAGGSVTAVGSFVIGSADLNEADMEQIDGITAGAGAASKALVLDASSRIVSGVSQITASYFSGDGSGLTNITLANTDAAGSDTQVQFNQNGEFAASAGMTYNGTGSLTLSASNDDGLLETVLNFGAASTYIGAEEDDGDVVYSIKSSVYGIDISGSADAGVALYAGTGADAPVAVQGQGGFKVLDADGDNTVAAISVAGAISGSSIIEGSSLKVDSVTVITAAQQLQNIASLDATTEATVEAAIDTLANLASAGATGVDLDILGPLDVQEGIKQNGSEILSDAGALGGLTTISGSGALSAASLVLDSVAVTATAAELNYNDIASLGTGVASKALVFDADGQFDGTTNGLILSASYFKGDGSGLTGISSDTVDTTTDSSNATFYLPFVNQATGADGEDLYIHDVLSLNPSSSLFKINESGVGKASLVLSASVGVANAWGGKDKGIISFPGQNASADTVNRIYGGYANVGSGDMDFLGIEAGGTDALLYLSGSHAAMGVYVDSSFTIEDECPINLASAIEIDGDANITLINGATIDGGGMKFKNSAYLTSNGTELLVSGSQMCLNITSSNDGDNSLFTQGSAILGHLGSGVGDVKLFAGDSGQAGNISGSRDLEMGRDIYAKESVYVGDLDTPNQFLLAGNSGILTSSANVIWGGSATGLQVDTQLTASGGVLFENVLKVNGNVTMGGLGSSTVDLTADLMIIDDGAAGSIKTTSLANYSTAIAGAGITATAGALVVTAADESITVNTNDLNVNQAVNGGLQVTGSGGTGGLSLSGSALVTGDFSHGSWYNDTIMFVDVNDYSGGSTTLKKVDFSSIATKFAGAGLTATNGVLSVSSVSTPTSFGDADTTMVEGLNYASATLTAARTLTLPDTDDLDVGEFVKIKMAAGVSGTNYASVVIKPASGDLIDGDASIRLESPYAAVNLYKVAVNVWRIL